MNLLDARLAPSPSPFLQTFGIKSDLLGLLPGRQTYVIDTNGTVVLSFNDQFNVEQHVDEALKVRYGTPAVRRGGRGVRYWECTAGEVCGTGVAQEGRV